MLTHGGVFPMKSHALDLVTGEAFGERIEALGAKKPDKKSLQIVMSDWLNSCPRRCPRAITTILGNKKRAISWASVSASYLAPSSFLAPSLLGAVSGNIRVALYQQHECEHFIVAFLNLLGTVLQSGRCLVSCVTSWSDKNSVSSGEI